MVEQDWTKEDLKQARKELEEFYKRVDSAAMFTRDEKVRKRAERTERILRAALMTMDADPDDPYTSDPAGYLRTHLTRGILDFGLRVI